MRSTAGASFSPVAARASVPGRLPLDATAAGTMLLLCVLWGLQQVAVKVAAPWIPLVTQAALRSVMAAALLVAWARWRGVPLTARDGTLLPGILAGVGFAGEFLLIYAGLGHTTAARMVVFLYTAPCLTALGLAFFVTGEKLALTQWAGIALAFAGIAAGFGEAALRGSGTVLGDAMGLGAALFWTATTVLIRATRLTHASATKVLFYQLVVSAPLLAIGAVLRGEPAIGATPAIALASMAFQTIVVAFASYLAWFWLLTRYLASRLAVFSFMTPLFGVLFGVVLLGESLAPTFGVAIALVTAGIALVNLRR